MITSPTKVLLIDDDDGDYFLTKDLLEEIDKDGFDVDWKSNYDDGLGALTKGGYDICLLDHRLGSHTGLELFSEAKERQCTIPVIILTGQSEQDVDFSAMKLGAADFLEKKDLTPEKLGRAIRYSLWQHRHSEELERQVAARTQDLAISHAALQESEVRFRHLADSMPQIVWISEPDGTNEYINTQWIVYTGLTLQESRTFEQSKEVIHPDDWERLQQSWNLAREKQSVHEVEVRLKHVVQGEYRWFLSRTVPVFNAEGKLIKWYGTSTDIHDQKLQEVAQRELSRRKDEFLASMAHELRNPLPPIRNALEIMRLADNNPQVVERSRTMIERQLNQLIRLIEDLLDLSRFTRGTIRLRIESLDLQSVIDAAVETSRPHIEAAQHQLTVLVPPESVHFEGDFTRLTQVVVNLLNNAARYTNPKGEILLSALVEDEHIVIKVMDNGMGIDPQHLEHIFDMFSQAGRSEHQTQSGLGIGLALVRSIVQLHSGTIEARSQGAGKGSEFVLKVPISQSRQ